MKVGGIKSHPSEKFSVSTQLLREALINYYQVEKQPILDRYIPAHPVDRYTFKKWNTDDWFRHNENKYFQSEQDRGQAENTREEAKQLIQSSQNKTNSTQAEVTERLGERLQNINLWKFELEKTIRDMVRSLNVKQS